MKKAYSYLIASLLLLLGLCACGSSKEFSSLKGEENIDVIHIPRSLGWLAGATSLMSGDSEAASLLSGFKSLDIVSCEGNGDREKIYDVLGEVLKADNSELFIEVVENKEKTSIYGHADIEKKKIKNMIIVTEEPGELSLIRARGSFNLDSFVNGKLGKSSK